jgi:predicted TIM-barrel fold metal-dependent hydrolase
VVIDTHVHILDAGFWPDEWFDWVALQWASQEPGRVAEAVRPRIEPGLLDGDASLMLADMDTAGVDLAVILPLDWGPTFTAHVSIEEVNEHAARLAELHSDRLIAFAGVDPRRPGAAELVSSHLASGRAKGVKLYPPAGFDPFDECVHPIYELCVQHRAPVLFHTGETLPKLRVRYGDPLLLQDVHAEFPELITWIGHAGARIWWDEALSVAAHSINSYLELSVWIWDDLNEERERTFIAHLAEARERIGVERLIFGSDHLSGPRVRGRQFLPLCVDWYRNLPQRAEQFGFEFTDAEVDMILGGNAARLLAVDRSIVS